MAEFDLRSLATKDVYQLLSRVVAPRPIALVSSLSAEAVGNLAPYSFFNLGGMNPPSLVFCPLNDRNGATKDTVRNVEETGEFVVNVVTRAMAERMNQTSFSYNRGTDEFDAVGFSRAASVRVKPPRVAESPVSIEATLFSVVRHGDGPLASNYVIGEALHVHVHDAIIRDGAPDHRLLDLIGRMGGDDYCHAGGASLFALSRPDKP